MPNFENCKSTSINSSGSLTNYKLGLKRSPSMFFDGVTTYQVEDNVLGKGRGGVVRELIPHTTENNKSVKTLVVKKNLDARQKSTNLLKAKEFIDTAYPELSQYTHVFNSTSGKDARLIMPKMGDITLYKILSTQSRTVNSRHAYYIKAIDAVIALNEKGFSHNDVHTGNIIFDDKDNCFLIDGERFSKRLAKDLDLEYLKYRDVDAYTIKPSSLWNESIFNDKQYMPNTLYTKIDNKKQYIEYHILNQQGKIIKGKITREDCHAILSPEDYKKIMDNIFDYENITPSIVTQLEKMHPILLDVTSYKGHTVVGRGNVLSENFYKNTQNRDIRELKDLKNAIINEMKSNHELTLNLAQRLHVLLTRSIEKALENIVGSDVEKLKKLQTMIKLMSVNPIDFPFDERNTKNLIENTLSKLVSIFYEIEHITYSVKTNRPFTFMFAASQNPYLDACELVDVIREELRCNQIHIPGTLLQRTEVIRNTANTKLNDNSFIPLASENDTAGCTIR